MTDFRARTLYFYGSQGCAACHAAEPIVAEFEKKHPEVLVIRMNADLHDHVEATPLYKLSVNGAQVREHVGTMDMRKLERFVE